MEAVARLRNVSISSRKVSPLASLLRGISLVKALAILRNRSQESAVQLRKLLVSAVANWQNKYTDIPLEKAGLFVKKITVDRAGMLKRIVPASRGRAHRIRKRSSHISVVLTTLHKNISE